MDNICAMAELHKIVESANEWLNIAEVPDYSGAINGLQLENDGSVTKIVAAVDACLPVIRMAVDQGADLLVVHHGMFWNGARPFTGSVYEKLKLAMDHNLAIYSSHIPLDVHPELGNNACLAKALGFTSTETFFPWKGIQLGIRQKISIPRGELLEMVAAATGAPAHICPGGPEEVRDIGIITGGAGSEVFAIAETGIDTFITGEGPHWSYTAAEELGLNIIYAGHYATETFGVKALARRWCDEFAGLEWEFVDHPTGL
ncbi:MAG: Nif3-like dinuclear metal center hexameric protein [Verrucomicrobiales bacterium]|nr:Nif3-like dinuclear metal center hexameric protein [Verrucomicrobiales bacterium]